ncbi:ketopantoate reductase family protein [Virgibacillus sp. MSP4-1]|uniref:ketopantoate reductase family protein n=1 Tax=Virgibacillus sp. MSP4-1 TaxID=2700081 RepID=UPI0003A70E15|nr:ketopantoate reductase family protein [Virgibacillus sp. MSP4-1]QHS21530.1 ketopantoate reductase family protein [Virgibacillus sp. MSP4-1]
MNVVVIGAGAVGGYFGGKLAKNGESVYFLVRSKRYEQLTQRGLNIKSVHGDFSFKPNLIREPEEIANPDLVIIGLKNYHLEGAMPQIEKLVEQGAKLLPLLNGVEHLDVLTEKFGREKVLGGLCYIESTLNDKGDIIQKSPIQEIIFGPLIAQDPAFLKKIERMMMDAELQVTYTDDILEEVWKKFIFITSLSGITSAVRAPIGVALDDEVTQKFLRSLITEVYEISRVRKIGLPDDTVDTVLEKLEIISPELTSSMHRDLQKGLPMELDSMHGYLLEQGEKYQLNLPCLRAVYALLHPYKNGRN